MTNDDNSLQELMRLQELTSIQERLKKSMGEYPIDILIPYHDNKDTIGAALASIAVQTVKDNIRVLICNDSSEGGFSVELLEIANAYQSTRLCIEVYSESFCNVGQTRQSLLERAKGKYIMFLDADDILYTPYVVEALYNALERNPTAAIVTSPYLEERISADGQKALYQRPIEITTLLGKMYRREFLTEHNIYFPKARRNEDAFFNQLLACYGPTAIQIEQPTYVWKYNPNSLSRDINNKDLSCERKSDYLETQICLYEEKKKRNIISKNDTCIRQTLETIVMTYLYYCELFEENEKKADEFQKQCVPLLKSGFSPFRANTYELDDNLKRVYLSISNSFPTLKQIIPVMTFKEFCIQLISLSWI